MTKLSLPEGNFVLAGVRDITDRKYIERELTATKDYLKTVFNNIHDAIYVHDNTGKIIDVNNKMLELHKCTREEAVSHYIHDFSTPDNPLNEMPHLWNTVLEGKNHFFEWKCRRPKDGSTIDVEIYLTRLSLPEGNLVLANVRDITERKRIEKLLVKEREIFFSVMENNPHGIALADDDGKFIYLNPEFTNISGYTLEDVPTAREWARKAYPDAEFRKKVVEVWKADRVPKGRGKDMEFAVTCRNGQQKDVEFRQTYLGDRSLVVLTDTTARNRAEKDLRAEKQKFQTLSESSPVGMVMIGETGGFEFRYVNPKFKDIFGYRAFDTPGINEWFARIYPEPASRLRSIAKWIDVVKAIKPGTGRSYIRKLNGNGGGQKHIKFILVRLETGEILMTCWDITRNKEAEEKIRERNLVLEVLNDVMGSVGSSIHLQEILAALQGVFTKKLKIPAGAIFLYNEVSSKNNMEAWWGVPESARDDVEAFALECYRNGKIIHEDDATLVRNEVCNLDPKIVAPFKRHKWTSYLCAPLSAKGDVQGMIFLVDKKHDGFNDDGVALYKTLGQQIGVATQNARLFEQVRLSHAQMKALSLRLVEVQEAERRYIARELHDEIGQELTGLKLALEMAARQREGTIPSGLRQAQSLANKLVELVRELSLNLRPAILDDLGLLLTLPWHFTRFTNQTGIRVNFEHTGLGNRRLPIQMETAVYRIIQEALTNVARHAKTGEVTVRLWADNGVVGTQIEDPGIGFDTALVLNNCSTNGIGGMRERAMLLGGHFTVESQPGAGTRLTAELPTGGHHGPNQDSPGR
ncbi:MAG: Oxygen sensor histidine kinase NreB [Syntrophorhabdaceae bacterium PtaU1.Bin034]|nr:MAG: Oxygen sensor histidine kinase NreB [Syntrophorhabdaceae bacterium PtaU1.Bin034]